MFEQRLLDAANEANDAMTRIQTADRRVTLDEQQVEELLAATEKPRLLVEYTDANYLEVLTALQNYLSARLTLASDRIEQVMGLTQLYHALGGGTEE